ncbi:MAG: ABC transporter permease [Mycobacterium sp.]
MTKLQDTPPAAVAGTIGGIRSSGAVSAGLQIVRLGPLLLLLLLAVVLAIATPHFLSPRNFANVGLEASVVAVLALGQLLVIITAGIDLSVGAAAALSGVIGALWIKDFGITSGWLVIPTMILAGGLIGLINGLLFVKGRMPHAFLPTLAMLEVARGVALVLSDSQSIPGMPKSVLAIGAGKLGPIPYSVIVVILLAIAVWALLARTPWGQWIYATGANKEGARRVGIPVDQVLVSVYVMSGLSAGVAAVIIAGQVNAAYPTAGNLLELSAIAAVIIGGASFFGGRGTVVGALIGALMLGTIRNGLNLLLVETNWQLIAIGVVIAVAVEMDVIRGWLETRLRVARTEMLEGKGK